MSGNPHCAAHAEANDANFSNVGEHSSLDGILPPMYATSPVLNTCGDVLGNAYNHNNLNNVVTSVNLLIHTVLS